MGLFFNTTPAAVTEETPVTHNHATTTTTNNPNTTTTSQPSQEGKAMEPQTVSSFLGISTLDPAKRHPMAGISSNTLDYITLDEGHNRSTAFGYIPSRSYSDDIMYGTGAVYLLGLGAGGLYGAREGLKVTKGAPNKIRFNGLLNGCTRRGPFVGNSLGILALGYTSINSLADYFGAPDTKLTAIASGALTGMLFKSTAGLKSSLIAGTLCGSLVSLWKFANEAYSNRPSDYGRLHAST